MLTTNPPRSLETKRLQREAGRTVRKARNVVTRRVIRLDSDVDAICARATRTVVADTETGFDYKPIPVKRDNRWTFAEAQAIVSDEVKRLARKTKPVIVPDDYNDPGYMQALSERMLQIVAHNRDKDPRDAIIRVPG